MAETAAPPVVTVDSTMIKLEEIQQAAMKRGHTAVALNATLAMAKFAGLDKPDRGPAMPKFDGNYHEAARRIALLLRLGKDKPAKAAKKIMKRPDGQSP